MRAGRATCEHATQRHRDRKGLRADPSSGQGSTTVANNAQGEVTRLLGQIAAGNAQAKVELLAYVYEELRRMARSRMQRERPGHGWESTDLVHEAYFRLLNGQLVFTKTRAYFFRAAATAMHQLLREAARKRHCRPEVDFDPEGTFLLEQVAEEVNTAFQVDLLDLLTALEELATIGSHGERQNEVVRLRIWGGLTNLEIAQELGMSVATVERDWLAARAWLHNRLKGGKNDD